MKYDSEKLNSYVCIWFIVIFIAGDKHFIQTPAAFSYYIIVWAAMDTPISLLVSQFLWVLEQSSVHSQPLN